MYKLVYSEVFKERKYIDLVISFVIRSFISPQVSCLPGTVSGKPVFCLRLASRKISCKLLTFCVISRFIMSDWKNNNSERERDIMEELIKVTVGHTPDFVTNLDYCNAKHYEFRNWVGYLICMKGMRKSFLIL